MSPEEYRAHQRLITTAIYAYLVRSTYLFLKPELSPREWLQLLETIFPEVQRRYDESAEVGRRFYDSQRFKHIPELPRNDQYKSELRFDWFVENMEPVRKALSEPDATQEAANNLTARVIREIEMAARRQVIKSVEDDVELDNLIEVIEEQKAPETVAQENVINFQEKMEKLRPTTRTARMVKGWARVATGSETCAFCLMLISRGPVYANARKGGFMGGNQDIVDIWNDAGADIEAFNEEVKPFMKQWHVNCDCMVVPVFDLKDWPGMEAHKRAEELWIQASTEAAKIQEEQPDRVYRSGKNKGKPVSFVDDALNALRRMLASGEASPAEYAAFAA